MPRSERSLAVTDAYAARLAAVGAVVSRLVLDRWRAMDPKDLDASFRLWLPAAVAILTQGQREAVRVSDAYLARFLSVELERRVAPQGLDPDAYAGRTRDGRDVRLVLGLGIVSTKLALGQGRKMPAALAPGAARVVRATHTEVLSAGRASLADAMSAEERVVGYRRVVHSRHPCGACLGLASGALRHTNHNLEIHPRCSCSAEPVVSGVAQDASRPTGSALFESMDESEQDALFEGRGGAEKADLIRSGSATLADLVSRTEAPEWGLVITETPLEALV